MAGMYLRPIVFISALVIVMSGCGSGPPPEFLYLVSVSSSPNTVVTQLSSFKVDSSTGALSPTSTIMLGSEAGIAVDPASRFLYLTEPPVIDIFSIDPTTGAPTGNGGLLLTVICPFCPPSSGPGALAFAPSGKFLYYGSSTVGLGAGSVVQGIGALAVNSATGALSSVTGSPFPADQVPISVLMHPFGQFVYTENAVLSSGLPLVLGSISGFAVDSSTGALAPVSGSPFSTPANANVEGFAMHPSGKFLYAATGPAANGILGWSVDGTSGGLTVLPGSPFQAGIASLDIALDPGGKFLYVSAGASGGMLGFNIDANSGALIPLADSPFFTGATLSSPVVDPSGRFLFAVDSQNSTIVIFALNGETGALTALGNPTSIGTPLASLTIVKAPSYF